MARDEQGPEPVKRRGRWGGRWARWANWKRTLVFLLGRPSWEAPAWGRASARGVRRVASAARRHPGPALASLGVLLLVIAGGVAIRRWWSHRPRPLTVTLQVVAPEVTRIEEKIRPKPLRIEFDDSVAPLDKIDKPVTVGIALDLERGGILSGLRGGEPGVAASRPEGVWRWTSDRELTFTPRSDWPIGQAFAIHLAKKGLVAPHVRLERYDLSFTTAPFEVTIAEVEFNQDPVNPALKKVVTTFHFSHPVDPASFEPRVKLHLEPSDREDAASSYEARITYDRLKGAAYVHSTPITIPRHDATFWVTLGPGTRAARGGPADDREQKDKVVVPGLYNLLKVTSADVALVDNEKYEPEQALIVETSVGVADKDLASVLRATLLPERTPDGEPAHWSPEAIDPADLARGTAVALGSIASEQEFPTAHSFKVHVPVGRQVYLRVGKGLRAFGGYILGETFQTVVEVPPFPQMLRILQNGSLLATTGDHKLPVLARDVPAIKYEIGRVLPGQLQHLVTQSGGDFAHPDWTDKFDQTNLAELFEEIHRLKAAPGKPEYDALDLSRYITGSGSDRRGLFLLRAQSWDPERHEPLGEADGRLVLVSDLGILVKENGDGTHEAFVESIRSGDPVPEARVEVLGKNGQRVLFATTDREGHASLPSFKDLHREREPSLYLVSTSKDQAFLPVGRGDRQLDTSRFDVGGMREEPTSGAAKGLTAFLFSDRGIYRPGDEIRVGLVVKSKDWSGRLGGLPLQVIITDARGLAVKEQNIKLGATGFEEIRHTTPEIAAAGTYSVNVYVVKDGHPSGLLGSTTVQVREFLPDRMKIHAVLSSDNPQGWVAPDGLKARVTLANLFGTPAADRKVRTKLNLSPWLPSFGQWRDYTFFDPLRPREGISETLADVTTNDEGVVEVDLGLQRFSAATYRLTLTAEGFEAAGGRSVVADASAIVSPLPFLIGYKADGDLRYIARGADRHVELVAIGPSGHRMKVDGLRAVLLERRYVSVLARQDKGTYRYQSVKKEVELWSKPLEIGAEGGKRKLATDRAGDFTLALRNSGGQELQRVEFSVTGYGNLSRDIEKSAELQLALKNTDVAPGDELEMQIKAPFTGAGLITVERDHVYAWKWFKTTTSATVEHIRVPESLEGGGYVSVAFVRDPASDEIFMSPLSHGIVPFSISRARRRVKVELDAPDLARPGEPLRIKVRTDRPTKVAVFAVDEGILRVADYKTPDPLGFFFQKRALSVRTSQILDLILPEFQRLTGGSAPGGDADAALGANLNPFRRKQQKPVAYWSGILDAGPVQRELVYDVPDSFNGTLRVMAVAVAPDALGSSDRRALVRGDFVISPNVPTFLAPGDETEVSVSVANNVSGSGNASPVTLAMKLSGGLEPVGPTEQKLKIAELREGSASFRLRARAPVGPATLTFTASAGKARSRLAAELSVRPPAPYLATFQAGHLREGQLEVPVTRHLYGELRRAEAGISHLPLGLTFGLRGYLEKFPHGCTEQIVSQAVPALALGRHPEIGYSAATAAAAVNRWIGLLRARQNQEGAFGRWAANPEVDVLASVWATHMLIEARERGFAVPTEMIKAATGYLQTIAANDVEDLAQAGVRSYAIYVLTRGGMMTSAFAAAAEKHLVANHPKEWRHDLAGLYLAATYRLLQQDRTARDILEGLTFGLPRAPDGDWYSDRLAFDAQALYIISRHFPERAARVTATEIDKIVDPIFRGNYNTYSSAWSILALEAYGQRAREADALDTSAGSLKADEIVGGQPRPLTLPASLLPVTSFSSGASAVRFEASGPYGAYWVLAEGGFDLQVPDKPESHAVEIFRTYEGADGKPVSSVKLGEEITAIVRLRTLGRAQASHLAVVDLLPGGFEPVVQKVAAGTGGTSSADAADGEEGDGEGSGEGEGDDDDQAAGGVGQAGADPANGGDVVEPAAAYELPIALPGGTFPLEFGDVREDRVVLYGPAAAEMEEIRYVIKATNVGTYTVPPVQARALYDNTVFARGQAGKLVVVPR